MYIFPLESVLNHRKSVEEGFQKELGILNTALDAENRAHRLLKEKRRHYSEEHRRRQKEKITVSESGLYINYIQRLEKEIKVQQNKIAEIEKQVEVKRDELLAAMKNRKILEKLKQKKKDCYSQTMNRKERIFMDEMGTVRYKPGEAE